MSTPSEDFRLLDPVRQLVDRINRPLRGHQSITVMLGMAVFTTILPFIVLFPPFSGFSGQKDWIASFADAGVYVLLALGLNVVVGLAGLLDLGYAAFFAIGAYTYAYGASPFAHQHVAFWVMLLIGAATAAMFGILLGAPTLRLRGDYLAIVTLGFGEIVPVVFLNSDTYTNGTNGITALYPPAVPIINTEFDILNPIPWYITMVLLITVAMMLLYRLQDSRLGRAWMAIREDELAAASMGINTVTTKLLAFAIGASTSGLAGVYLSSKLSLVSPNQFSFVVSFTVLAMVVLGGMGNIWGVAAGAFVIYELLSQGLKGLDQFFATFLPSIHLGPINFDFTSIEFLNYQYLLYGLALVGMMLLRPEGLFPSRRRKAELHDAEDAGAANQELVEA